MKIGIVHMTLKLMSKKQNLDRTRRMVKEARSKGARIVILPSMVNIGPVISFYTPVQSRTIVKNHAERIPSGNTSTALASIAASQGVFMIVGPIVERAGPRIFLSATAYSPTGLMIGKYRKMILDLGDEKLGFSPGKSFSVFKIKEKFGVLIEGDVNYPEVARALSVLGATVLVSYPRIEPGFDERIKKLLEARSIENNLPIISVGGIVKSQGQLLDEAPTLIIDPSEGVLEEIRLAGSIGESDGKPILVEIQGGDGRNNRIREKILELTTLLYKTTKKSLRRMPKE